jgi:hypothetical protein
MSVNIPHSLTMPVLSSLPGNSFRIRKITHFPSDRSVAEAGRVLKININAPPNFFMLGNHTYVEFTEKLKAGSRNPNGTDVAGAGVNSTAETSDPSKDPARRYRAKWGCGWQWSRVRETFNSGSYSVSSMDDPNSIGPIMTARGWCSRRNSYLASNSANLIYSAPQAAQPGIFNGNYGIYKMVNANQTGSYAIAGLESAGYVDDDIRADILPRTAVAAANDARGVAYSVPLSAYSRMGTKDFVPVGFLGSYSSEAWGLEFTVAQTDVAISDAAGTKVNAVNNGIEIHNLRIQATYVEILDEDVMAALTKLYTQEETLQLGGGQSIPMKMEIPYLAYSYSSHILSAGTNNTVIRINTNSPSVRGILICDGISSLANQGDLSKVGYRWRGIKVVVGGHCVQEIGYSLDDNKSNPQIESDLWTEFNNTSHMFSLFSNERESLESASAVGRTRYMVTDDGKPKFIAMSFENSPHFSLSESELASARGIDARNIGVIEVHLKFERADGIGDYPGSNNPIGPADQTIFAVLAHDEVVSVTRSGVNNITQSVL